MVASRWRHCVKLTGMGIEPQTYRTDYVGSATEPTAGLESKSNLHYTRDITLKRVTSCGAHLRGFASGQHSSEGTSQRWQAVGDTMPIRSARKSNPRPAAPIECA